MQTLTLEIRPRLARLVLPAALAALSGCATLEPASVSAEVQHDSHVMQHFGNHRTNYGYQAVGVSIHWQFTPRWYADAFEGVDFGGCSNTFGAGHETFTARAGYEIWRRP